MGRPAKPRLSAQQEAIRRGGRPISRELYGCNPGPQHEFKRTQAEEVLYGGAAGGGKSYALRAWAVNYCMTYPGARVALFRRSYRELEESHLLDIQQEVPTEVAFYSSGSHNLVFPNGSVLLFRYCEKDEDARSYDTTEFDAILFDELTHFSLFQYTYLTSRCRSAHSWWPGPRIRAATNPGGPGHDWVKARWIEDPNTGAPYQPMSIWRAPAEEGGFTRQFIPAKLADNPKINPRYIDTLRALPEEEYRAKALGDWNTFTGQFFARWRPDIHTIDPFVVPPDWDRFLAIDYGYNAPWAGLFFARPPATQSAFVYRELYGEKVRSEEQIFRARQVITDSDEKIRAIILDPSMFSKQNVKGDRFDSLADDWKREFAGVPVIRGVNDRVQGWALVRRMLDWVVGPGGQPISLPRLQVMRNCTNLIRTLPKLQINPSNVEDVNTESEDHAADALRYGLMFAFQGNGRVIKQPRYVISSSGIIRRG